MGTTHFSGPVNSASGFTDGSGANIVTGADLVAVTATAAEIDTLAGVTPGTALASKAVVLNASKGITTITSATITTLTSTAATITTVTGNVTGNLTGYRVGAVNLTQSTIVGAAGASNVCTVTIQLKDGAGTNLTGVKEVLVYKSSAADGLTLGAAASTGFSVASGGLSVNNAAAITTSIRAMTSATGGLVLSLTDTNKATDYLVLSTADGIKVSLQLSAGSYGA